MTTEGFAKTGHPAWARLMWHDADAIYMEMPVTGHPPIIMKFRHTEGGLTEALKMMKVVYDAAGPHRQRNGWNLDHPIIQRDRPGAKPKPKMTTESRSIARSVLKKLGLI
jgi:hypothetical protein